jgi:hypothetical protein
MQNYLLVYYEEGGQARVDGGKNLGTEPSLFIQL